MCIYFNTLYFVLLQKDEVYLNLVLEYIPETVYKVARHYSKSKQTIPTSFIKVRCKFVHFFYYHAKFVFKCGKGNSVLKNRV